METGIIVKNNGYSMAAILLISAFVLLFAFLVSLYAFLSESKYVRKTCSDFSSYREAKKAYDEGALNLDRDGDEVPCEELFVRDIRRINKKPL